MGLKHAKEPTKEVQNQQDKVKGKKRMRKARLENTMSGFSIPTLVLNFMFDDWPTHRIAAGRRWISCILSRNSAAAPLDVFPLFLEVLYVAHIVCTDRISLLENCTGCFAKQRTNYLWGNLCVTCACRRPMGSAQNVYL